MLEYRNKGKQTDLELPDWDWILARNLTTLK
jgi:hypothetical protein